MSKPSTSLRYARKACTRSGLTRMRRLSRNSDGWELSEPNCSRRRGWVSSKGMGGDPAAPLATLRRSVKATLLRSVAKRSIEAGAPRLGEVAGGDDDVVGDGLVGPGALEGRAGRELLAPEGARLVDLLLQVDHRLDELLGPRR